MRLIEVANLSTVLLSTPVTLMMFWFYLNSSTKCMDFLYLPFIAFEVIVALVSLLEFIGSYRRALKIHLCAELVLVLSLFAFTIFTVSVTDMEVAQVISEKEHKGYTNWLQKHFIDGDKWFNIKSCLLEIDVCESFPSEDLFYRMNFSPTQSGCCKPPAECGVINKNATFSSKPESDPSETNSDCTTWSSNQEELCYDCKSCKAGVLATLKKDWRTLGIIGVFVLVCLLIMNFIGGFLFTRNLIHANRVRNRVFPVMGDL